MLFSREQLNQLAQSNGFSINKIISNQKRLSMLERKKVSLQTKIKDVLSSSDDVLPGGSSLLMGTINTKLLTSLGYNSIQDLIFAFEENDNEIIDIKKSVSEEDAKIKKSLSKLDKVDITKDMKDQVTQEVLLDSDLAEVKNNSQEILLMLSQSKSGSEVIDTALTHTQASEQKLIDYFNRGKQRELLLNGQTIDGIEAMNANTQKISNRLKDLSVQKKGATYLDRFNAKVSSLSTNQKNGLLATTFLGFLGLGMITQGGKTKPKDKSEDTKHVQIKD